MEERRKEEEFKPKIIVFACSWCSYVGADTAGVGKIQYPPNVRLIRVMCSGRVHPAFVIKAFERGADGVMVCGCHFGDCHYIFGNYQAKEQFEVVKRLIHLLGLEKERLRLEWIHAAQVDRFAQVVKEFVEDVKKVGRSPLALTNI